MVGRALCRKRASAFGNILRIRGAVGHIDVLAFDAFIGSSCQEQTFAVVNLNGFFGSLKAPLERS
jgi:hypothetical protein